MVSVVNLHPYRMAEAAATAGACGPAQGDANLRTAGSLAAAAASHLAPLLVGMCNRLRLVDTM